MPVEGKEALNPLDKFGGIVDNTAKKGMDAMKNGFEAGKEKLGEVVDNVKEKLNDVTNQVGNINIFDLKNNIINLVCKFRKMLEKPKTEIDISTEFILKLLEMFKELDDKSIDLLELYLTKYTDRLAKKYKATDEKKYNEGRERFLKDFKEQKKKEKEIKNKKKKGEFVDKNDLQKKGEKKKFVEKLFITKYFKFTFEDFLIVLSKYLRLIVGMHVKLEFFENKEVFVYLFLKKKLYPILAEGMNYELQLKPYAYQYRAFMEKKFLKKLIKSKLSAGEEREVLVSLLKEKEDFVELDHQNHLKFPPYVPYEICFEEKFRKYFNDDDYHNCYKDKEFRPYSEVIKMESKGFDKDNDDNLSEESFMDYEYYDDEDDLCKFKK